VPPWQRGEPAALDLIQATQVATPFPRPGWAYEEKVDGYRMLVYKLGGSVQLVSRQGKEFTQRFPALARDVAALGAESAILDTEVAVFDRQLVSRFECLMARPKDDVATPPMLMAFDLLELDGEDQRKRPLGERAGSRASPERRAADPARATLSSGGLGAWKEVLRANYGGWQRRTRSRRACRASLEMAQDQGADVSRGRTRILQTVVDGTSTPGQCAPRGRIAPRRVECLVVRAYR
jgi:ATP dependent DNA ligase domain